MPTNNPEYAKNYYQKRRKKLFKELGGKCYVCHTKKKLMVHRVYKTTVYLTKDGSVPKLLDVDENGEIVIKTLTKDESNERAKALFKNPDNMVLLCTDCFKQAERLYGRKTVIGRRKLHNIGTG
jgi:5-methylcytosine-specific restriction endonuclease McrA